MKQEELQIIPLKPLLAADFVRLSKAWLKKYFEEEPVEGELLYDR